MSIQLRLVETFLRESEELLADIEQVALSLDDQTPTADAIHQLFRSFHTLKGSGAMCGLESVAGFSHHVESLLDDVRAGTVPVTPALADLILKCRDHTQALITAEQGGPAVPAGSSDSLLNAIQDLAKTRPAERGNSTLGSGQTEADACGPEERTWKIRFRPNPSLLAWGGNPVALLRDLRKLGDCEIGGDTDAVPPLDAIEPHLCYLRWTITLRTRADENAIRDVFIFVEDGSELQIEPLVEDLPATDAYPEPHMESRAVKAPAIIAAASKAPNKESTVRVPAERLDRLVNLVGELVMNQSRLAQAAAQSGTADIINPVQELERLVAEMRDNVLGIRMLPIGSLFGRFRRLVHDLSAELGKEVDLVTEGAETELDKSILERLGDPLVHCLRNCLDHAAEPPEERLQKGKPRRATIHLSAVHTGSNVVIRIQDDGRGIDRDAVRAKAVEKQLVARDAVLSDKEIFNLILMPGFSTARQVTSVSGRGVGMDAVKRQIDALRGSLSLSSEAGKGTLISMTLPLTLAIIEGLLVQVGMDQFIIPMAAITENVELTSGEKARKNGRNVIAVRGELVPYVDLRQAFSIDGEAPSIEKVVIVQHEGDRVGLVVDRVLGTHQTVIQSLGKFYQEIEVISGATIMGDGRVSLILDIAGVVRFADRQYLEVKKAA